jgi:hypothetical protein
VQDPAVVLRALHAQGERSCGVAEQGAIQGRLCDRRDHAVGLSCSCRNCNAGSDDRLARRREISESSNRDLAYDNIRVKTGGPTGARPEKAVCRQILLGMRKNGCISLPDLTIIRKQPARRPEAETELARKRGTAKVSAAEKARRPDGKPRLSTDDNSSRKYLDWNRLIVSGWFPIRA